MVARKTKGTGETQEQVDAETPKVDADDLRKGSNGFAAEHLYSFVERFERLSEEIGALTDDRKEVMGEAKAMGFDTKILRMVIARRKLDSADRQEIDALLELYEEAVRNAASRSVAQSVAEGE